MFSPYLTTAEIQAAILKRHQDAVDHLEDDSCTSHEVISTPNGQSYGVNGHVPSDHSVLFYYPDTVKHLTVRQNMYSWTVHSAPGI